MDITYLGHSSFKLKGKKASLVTDPFDLKVGFAFPRVSADIVTVSHDHFDHANAKGVLGTSRRSDPFVIRYPGEYEVSGISIFGIDSFHDDKEGSKRGRNNIYNISIDGISVAHLGDLGQELSDKQVEEVGEVDVLFLPVGGFYTIDPKTAFQVMNQLQPSIVVPMHYKTRKHDQKAFGDLVAVDEFLKEIGFEQKAEVKKLSVVKGQLPEEMEVVILSS